MKILQRIAFGKMKIYFSFSLLLISFSLPAQIITTVAGNGTYGFSGNGGPATSAQMAWQMDVISDNAGNFYIADHDNNVIRKVNTLGIISNYAGTSIGYSGDGGPATAAKLYHPSWLGMDNQNNLYFSDQNSDVIRKIDYSTGIITSLTGALPSGYSGDGGLLINAQFRSITGIGFDNIGNMYISDHGNYRIRKVNSAGIISTVVGNGISGFSGDGGPAIAAQLSSPYGVVFDNAGNMYIPDIGNSRIRMVSPAGIITTVAGNGTAGYSGDGGPATSAQLRGPWAIDLDNAGNLYIGDALNYVVRKVATSGIITTVAGNGTYGYSGDGGPATLAQLGELAGVDIDPFGNLLISVREYFNVIRKVNNCPTASISISPVNVSLCNSGNAGFGVKASNASSYQWQVNTGTGWTDLVDNATYSGSGTDSLSITGASTAMNNYRYRCSIANNCGNIYSTAALLLVESSVTPALTITSSSTNICAGTSVTFSAAPVNGGISPLYQWQKNGLSVGTNSNTYIDNSINNGDRINCILTSNANCLITSSATSNDLVMTVTINLTPAVSITSSTNNICFGTPVSFNATATNGGPAPEYTWFKNNVNLFLNSPTYVDNGLNNGDIISCTLKSNLACVTSQVVSSLPITMNVTSLVAPSITITTSTNAACRNTAVVFTAIPSNEGPSPSYVWKKNGLQVGTSSNIYTDNTLVNGDVITCTLFSNSNCLISSEATSNVISATIYPDPIVTLDKTNTLCDGNTRTLDAGNFSSYLWNTGSTNRTINVNNTGVYSVIVTDNRGCTGTDITNISTLLASPSGFLPADTSVCSYGNIIIKSSTVYNSYLWNTGSRSSSMSISQPGQYWLEVVDKNGCRGRDNMLVSPKECLTGFYMPTAFTPNNDGKNDLLKPILLGNVKQYHFSIYNRWGQLIFQSTSLSKGWDGKLNGLNQDTNGFIWVCLFQFEGEAQQKKTGSVMLLR